MKNRQQRRHPEHPAGSAVDPDKPVRMSPAFMAAKARDLEAVNIDREEALIARGVRVNPAGFVERRLRALADVLELSVEQRARWELLYHEGVGAALTEAETQADVLEETAASEARQRALLEGVRK